MPIIEGFHVENYRVLKNITLGRTWNSRSQKSLTPLVVVIGKNGVGKSTLFDAFGFLSDCLSRGVEEACDMRGRGGYQKLVSAGTRGPIKFEIYYRESKSERPITYELSIGLDDKGRPFVEEERLRQRRSGQRVGRPFSFLYLREGKGLVWGGDDSATEEAEALIEQRSLSLIEDDSSTNLRETSRSERVELADRRNLGIVTLGALKDHPRINKFRNFLQGWYLSYFAPDAARSLPMAGPQKHLNVHGDNIGNVVQYMEREHGKKFKGVLERISAKIPGIYKIDTKRTEDDRVLLRFNDKGFNDAFLAHQMSDGTLKLFAYMLLLEDPEPAPFICIEEPENGLYHKLLEQLAEEFRNHAQGRKHEPQIFMTTHQPYLVNALSPEETWIIEKSDDGFSQIRRASDDDLIVNMVKEGLPLGNLWYSDYLDPR